MRTRETGVSTGAPVTSTQVPSRPGISQAAWGPLHALLQQTPSTQKPLAHCAGSVHSAPAIVRHSPAAPQTAREVYSTSEPRPTQLLNVMPSSQVTGSPERQQTMHGFGSAQLLASGKSPPELSHPMGVCISHVPSGRQHGTSGAGAAETSCTPISIAITMPTRSSASMARQLPPPRQPAQARSRAGRTGGRCASVFPSFALHSGMDPDEVRTVETGLAEERAP